MRRRRGRGVSGRTMTRCSAAQHCTRLAPLTVAHRWLLLLPLLSTHHCGARRVAVLQGGLPAWRAAGGEIDASSVDDATLHAATAAARHVRGTDLQQPHYPAQLKRDKVAWVTVGAAPLRTAQHCTPSPPPPLHCCSHPPLGWCVTPGEAGAAGDEVCHVCDQDCAIQTLHYP